MADVIITPASGLIDFQNVSGISSATIQLDGDGNLALSAAGGDIQIGDTSSDIFIGDGINNVDLIFEEDGEIRGLTGKTITLGQSDSFISFAGDITGNISVTGTVDGRDIASDGSKLDGIESGATADQTAAEILTLIKTVDGAGSGLDADTVDGIQASQFLRSNVADIATGNITFRDNILFFDNTTFSTFDWQNYQADGGDLTWTVGGTSGPEMELESDGSNYLNAELRVGGSKVWHAGNDGSGSGLDADTVDGIQGASFLRSDDNDTFTGNLANNGNNYITFGPNSTWSRYLRVGGNGYQGNTTTANIATTNGNLHLDAADGSFASYLNFYAGIAGVAFGNGNNGVVAWMGPDGDLWKGSTDNTGSKYWHAGNDGSGSGLDADTLDGNEASAFLTTSDTTVVKTTGNQSIAGTKTFTGIPVFNGGTSGSSAPFTVDSTQVVTNLNADLLDGINSASFLRSDANDIYTGTLTGAGNISFSGGVIEIGDGSGSVAMTINDGYGNANLCFNHASGVPDVTGNAFRITTNVDVTTNATITFQAKSNVTANTALALTSLFTMSETGATCLGNTVWHAGNDGSGSGLDADTLDGVNSGSFLRSDADTTKTSGQLLLNDSITIRFGTGADAQMFHNGSDMYFDFEVAGDSWYFRDSGDSAIFGFAESTGNLSLYKGSVLVGDGGDQSTVQIKKADNDTSDHIQFYNGTTRMGEIGCQDDTWLRINQVTNKNIYTPRYIRADNGFFVDGAGFGINGSGTLVSNTGATIAGNTAWHAGNDGAGSGLDADTLDGAQPSVSASNSTIVQRHSSGYIYANYFNTTPNDVTSGVTKVLVETGNDGFMRHGTADAIRSFINVESGATADQTASEILTAIKTVDGAGSGLDADLLDGISSASFLRSDANDTATGALTIGNAVYSNYTSADTDITGLVAGSTFGSLIESSLNAHLVVGLRDNDVNDSFSVVSGSGNYATDSTYDKLVFQAKANGTLTANGGNTIWHAANDGAGSGLDADTIDGTQLSNLMTLSGTQTITGDKDFDGTLTYDLITGPNTNTRDKIRVWSGNPYSIGMKNGFSYGGLGGSGTNYAMSFQMSDTTDRGWWWGDSTHTDAQGAASLTTLGKMTLAHSLRIGYGESDTTIPGATHRLDVSGSILATGDITAFSDINLKENIEVIPNALDKVSQIRGVTFIRKDLDDKSRKSGVIAQEVEKVLPEVVTTTEDGTKTVAYGNLVGLLIESIKELKAEVEELKKERN